MGFPGARHQADGMRKNIGFIVAGFSFLYGLAGLLWTFTGVGYPFGFGDPYLDGAGEAAFDLNILGLTTHDGAGPYIAGLGFLGAVVAFLMARGAGRGAARRVLIALGWVYAAGLAVAVQDYRPLMMTAYTPIFVVGKTLFGWPEHVGWDQLWPWASVNLLLLILAGAGFALTAIAYRRRTGAPMNLVRFGRPAVVVAVIVPLIYAATRWIWALGWGIGLDPEAYRRGQEEGLWLAGAALGSMGIGGALLTIGLLRPWGERFPRWMIGLAGRRVPVSLAVVPAVFVGVLTLSAGVMYIRMAFSQGMDDKWMTNAPETLWPLWGLGLIVAGIAYRQRRLAAEAVDAPRPAANAAG